MAKASKERILGWTFASRAILIGVGLSISLALFLFVGETEPAAFIDARLVVDPNTVPPEVLLALPRLGPALVGRIVKEREIEPFASIDDIDRRVKGIGPATIKSLRPYLKIETKANPRSQVAPYLGPSE